MNFEKTIFTQLMEFLPKYEFRKCVDRYQGNYKVKSFTCWDQFLCMAFAQLTYRESLRDIEASLRASQGKLFRMGFRGKISRNTLANANSVRDWRIYADFGQVLIGLARALYADEDLGVELDKTVYALDSTMIDLCLSLFPWAKFLRQKSAIKMHTLLDLRGPIPALVLVTQGKLNDVNILDRLVFEYGAFYIMDRGYLDFGRLYRIERCRAFFITRARKRFAFKRSYSHGIDKNTGVQCDQTISLASPRPKEKYPAKLRRIRYRDIATENQLVFLTNNFDLPAITVAQLYRCRWQVELFFKWIKQNLRIKSFYGVSENAVKTQIWIAISVYVLVAIVKKRLNLDLSLYTILQILSVTLFEKTPILQALTSMDCTNQQGVTSKQLNLFN